jgi:hypothetical protein
MSVVIFIFGGVCAWEAVVVNDSTPPSAAARRLGVDFIFVSSGFLRNRYQPGVYQIGDV